MNSDLYTNSIRLDHLISEKLKSKAELPDLSLLAIKELQTEINSLRYLLYVVNQDRLFLRQDLLRLTSLSHFSGKDSLNKSEAKDIEDPDYHLALYDITGNSSDICTVVNTSILPYSCENTEREFSPFSVSPLNSPRLQATSETGPTAIMTTELSANKIANKISKPPELPDEAFAEGIKQYMSDVDEGIKVLTDKKNYLMQLNGDDDEDPSENSEGHSRSVSLMD